MKYVTVGFAILFSSACVAHAQTAALPKAPPVQPPPNATTGMLPLQGGPCEAEMKAAIKKVSEIAPGKDLKTLTQAEMSIPEAKAVQDCLKKNAPKGGTAAPLPPSAGKTGAVAPGTDNAKMKAGQAGAPAAAPVKTMPPPVVKQSTKEVTAQCPSITKDLKVGSRDAEVIILKRFLVQEGLLRGIQNTNYFGSMTERALKEWQKKKTLVQSGITDVQTRAMMRNCVSKTTPKAPVLKK